MNSLSLIWTIAFILSTALFFIIAGFVSFYGLRDLKDLLSNSHKRDHKTSE